MLCIQCKKNQIRYKRSQLCGACWSFNYRKNHPEKYNYMHSGNKHKAFKRDNFTCQLCGEQNIKKLIIHHLDGNGQVKNKKRQLVKNQNNKLSNLITICRKCHYFFHKRCRLKIGEWSIKYNKCIKCGTVEKKHSGKGLCKSCYSKQYSIKNNRKSYKKEWYQERGKYLEKIRNNFVKPYRFIFLSRRQTP